MARTIAPAVPAVVNPPVKTPFQGRATSDTFFLNLRSTA